MTAEHLHPGAVWVRKSDGQETTIISHDPATTYNAWVVHKAKRTTHTERRNFLRKYEPKEQDR